MKKILFLITSLLLLTGCSKGKLSEISYNEFKTKLDNKEEFVLVIGRASCGHCLDYKETLNKVFEKYKVTLYYVDLDSFTSEEEEKFKTKILFDNNLIETPTTVYLKEGKEANKRDRIEGALTYSTVIDYLKEKGLIK